MLGTTYSFIAPYINKLNAGAPINSATFTTATPIEGFPIGGFGARGTAIILTIRIGDWAATSAQRGYCGFEFEAADGIHYGWVDIGMGNDVSSLTIYGYAFEEVAGAGILAGQTTGGARRCPSPPPYSSWAAALWVWASWPGSERESDKIHTPKRTLGRVIHGPASRFFPGSEPIISWGRRYLVGESHP